MYKIKKVFLIGILVGFVLYLASCSFIPRLSFDRPNTVPQKTEKSEKRERCNGEAVYGNNGKILTCSKGYSLNEKFYNKEERKLTFKEQILNFFANLKGYIFWIMIGLVIFAPGLIGVIIGNIFNGSKTALVSTIRAIKRAKSNGGNFMSELNKEHDRDRGVKKTINSIRAKIKD